MAFLQKLIIAVAALTGVLLPTSARGETYTSDSFQPAARFRTHALKLEQPLVFGLDGWRIECCVTIGKQVYVNELQSSWGTSVLASGKDAFPDLFHHKPFQFFIPIKNRVTLSKRDGGVPVYDEQGNAVVEGVTYVVEGDENKEKIQRPAPGERWKFTVCYNAEEHELLCSACNMAEPSESFVTMRRALQRVRKDEQVEHLSTSILGLSGWQLESLTITRDDADATSGDSSEGAGVINASQIFRSIGRKHVRKPKPPAAKQAPPVRESKRVYTSADFKVSSSYWKTHEMKLDTPLRPGAQDWGIECDVTTGNDCYYDELQRSWGTSVIASGTNAFPSHRDRSRFQFFFPVKIGSVRKGDPIYNDDGNIIPEGVLYMLGGARTTEASQLPAPGTRWKLAFGYKAAEKAYLTFAYKVGDEKTLHTIHTPVQNVAEEVVLDCLSTSILGLPGWKLNRVTVIRGRVPEPFTDDETPEAEPLVEKAPAYRPEQKSAIAPVEPIEPQHAPEPASAGDETSSSLPAPGAGKKASRFVHRRQPEKAPRKLVTKTVSSKKSGGLSGSARRLLAFAGLAAAAGVAVIIWGIWGRTGKKD